MNKAPILLLRDRWNDLVEVSCYGDDSLGIIIYEQSAELSEFEVIRLRDYLNRILDEDPGE